MARQLARSNGHRPVAPAFVRPSQKSHRNLRLGFRPLLQRRFAYEWFAMPDAAFRFLLQSFQATRQRGFCRGVHPIDEQDSMEMIVLMLDRPREKTARLDLKHLAFQRLRAHKHRLRLVQCRR